MEEKKFSMNFQKNKDFSKNSKILGKIVEHCKGFPIIRQPQKTLIGYTISANTANNLVDCLELCYMKYLKDQSCKSIMYFYEVSFSKKIVY